MSYVCTYSAYTDIFQERYPLLRPLVHCFQKESDMDYCIALWSTPYTGKTLVAPLSADEFHGSSHYLVLMPTKHENTHERVGLMSTMDYERDIVEDLWKLPLWTESTIILA